MKDMSDDSVAHINVGSTIATILSSLVALTGFGDLIVDNAIALVGQIATLTTAIYDAQIDTAVIEACKCEMYCELKKQGGWSAAIWEPWKARMRLNDVYQPINSGSIEAFMDWHRAVDDSEWNARASIGMQTPSAFCELCETCPEDCEEIEKVFVFEVAGTEGYSIIAGTQQSGYIEGISAVSVGYPEYPDLPTQPDPTNRVVYARLNLNCVVNRFQGKFQFRRHNSNPQTGAVSFFLYCYDDNNVLMFGGRLGGNATLAHDTLHTLNINVPGTEPVCIAYALVVVGCAATIQPGGYVQLHEVSTFLDEL
jgi:hypothetical protein